MGRAKTLLVAACLTLGLTAPAQASGLSLGFSDPDVELMTNPSDLAAVFQHAKSAGASVWGFRLSWSSASPTQPPSLAAAADPGWSGYNWTYTDRLVKGLAAAGLQPLPVPQDAPAWAEGPGRPSVSSTSPKGTWRPSPAWFGAFATALAKRYSGSYPDPQSAGTTLPAVTAWTAWNEPNLSTYLSPQWVKTKGHWATASPSIYRGLLNAFYAGVKSVAPKDTVVTAGTAPFGDLHPGDLRIMPALFWRDLLCVRGRTHPVSTHCGQHVHFDVINHHPYPIGPPRRHAINSDDVVVPDLKRITDPLKVAIKAGTVLPKGSKPLWITEISWDSYPDPDGLSLADQAQYLEGALNVLSGEGASLVAWFNVRDDPPDPSYASTYQSGVYEDGPTIAQDIPKPSLTAFSFPFTAYRSGGVARLWGLAPAGGPVTVQAQRGGSWTDVAHLTASPSRLFTGNLRVGRGTALRALSGSSTSLTWTTF